MRPANSLHRAALGLARAGVALLIGALLSHPSRSPGAPDSGGNEAGPRERRNRLMQRAVRDSHAAVSVLTGSLADDSPIVRRTAAHLLVRLGEPAAAALGLALEQDDFQVRLIALQGLADLGRLPDHLERLLRDDHLSVRNETRIRVESALREGGAGAAALMDRLADAFAGANPATRRVIARSLAASGEWPARVFEVLSEAAVDPSVEVREEAFRVLFARLDPASDRAARLFAMAAEDESAVIREIGFQARWEPRAAPPIDVQRLHPAGRVDVPDAGWRFRKDPDRVGHREGWHEPGWDDSEWNEVETGRHWHEFLGESYVGPGWYRRTVSAPEVPADIRVALHFSGVDEMAWAWVNGRYVGHHNIGASGWDVPFHLDVTGLLDPGSDNQITVRVLNTQYAGGIWRPVRFEFFRGEGP